MNNGVFENQLNAAEHIMSGQRQTFCKNAKLSIVTLTDEKDDSKVTLDIQNEGCKNVRRNGSAWCQECSDKHKSS